DGLSAADRARDPRGSAGTLGYAGGKTRQARASTRAGGLLACRDGAAVRRLPLDSPRRQLRASRSPSRCAAAQDARSVGGLEPPAGGTAAADHADGGSALVRPLIAGAGRALGAAEPDRAGAPDLYRETGIPEPVGGTFEPDGDDPVAAHATPGARDGGGARPDAAGDGDGRDRRARRRGAAVPRGAHEGGARVGDARRRARDSGHAAG